MNEQPVEISVVVPLYRCHASIKPLHQRLEAVFSTLGVPYEYVFVNDCSPENDWEIVKELATDSLRVNGVSLSRNFGQHAAIFAGLERARGAWIVVMDGDLQDLPEEIPKLYAAAQEGWDYVLAARQQRKDHLFKKLGSRLFYAVLGYLTETRQEPEVANFGIYSRKVTKAMLSMQDKVKFLPAMLSWVGFRGKKIPISHGKRDFGASSYSLRRLLQMAGAVILGFSDKPLRMVVRFGLSVTLIAVIYGIYTAWQWHMGRITEPGYSSIIISIWFLAGVHLSVMGMIGLYLGRVYELSKGRPYFVIDEVINP